MKSKMIIALMMLFCISCTNNNKPISDAERQQITNDVKAVSDQIFKAAGEANSDALTKLYYDVPGSSILMPDGKKMTGAEFNDMVKDVFSTIDSQKITTIAEDFNIISRNIVWYTNISKTLINLKDSSIIEQNPWSSYFLFKKIDNQWRWVAGTESGHTRIVRPASLPKDLDQVGLSKQWLGKWRRDNGDTVTISDRQAFGNTMITLTNTTVKGKPYVEVKQLWGFDRVHNRLTYLNAFPKGSGLGSLKFTSPTTFTIIPYDYIAEPQYAPFRIEGEFTDPETLVQKQIFNNETTRTYTSKRIK